MDAPCEIQGSIHVFRLVNNMCPGKWVHISIGAFFYFIVEAKSCITNYTTKIHKFYSPE